MKSLKTLVSVLIITVLFVGCAKETEKIAKNKTNKKPNVTSVEKDKNSKTTNPEDNYDAAGEIIDIQKNKLTLLSGDIAEDFKIDDDILEKFYVGQSVLIKGNEVFPFIPKDPSSYNIKHTNMGELIMDAEGKVKSVEGDTLILTTLDGESTFKLLLSEDDIARIQKDTNVTVSFLDRGGEKSVINIFDEDNTMEVKIDSIEKSERNEMVINASQTSGGRFIITVTPSTDLNFNHSELKAGDVLKVYPTMILESDPAQVSTNKIVLFR